MPGDSKVFYACESMLQMNERTRKRWKLIAGLMLITGAAARGYYKLRTQNPELLPEFLRPAEPAGDPPVFVASDCNKTTGVDERCMLRRFDAYRTALTVWHRKRSTQAPYVGPATGIDSCGDSDDRCVQKKYKQWNEALRAMGEYRVRRLDDLCGPYDPNDAASQKRRAQCVREKNVMNVIDRELTRGALRKTVD